MSDHHDSKGRRLIRRCLALLIAAGAVLAAETPVSAQSSADSVVYVSLAGASAFDDILYRMSPAGTGIQKVYDFKKHPKHTTGRILNPRVAGGGLDIYFSSDNSYLYTPSNRNLFRVPYHGKWYDQITPGPNSGLWDSECPCGVVRGTVKRADGNPYSGSPVYMEGKNLVYSGADGSFRFDSVPRGSRWIVAYRPGDANVSEAREITVVSGTTQDVHLAPDSSYRSNLENPIPFGSRVYHTMDAMQIQWTDLQTTAYKVVYKTSGLCTGTPLVDGYDVGRITGKLAIADYQTGCTGHEGIYVADKDGSGLKNLANMKGDFNWCGVDDVFWSPNEKRLAINGCYSWYSGIHVLDASNGRVLGSAFFNNQSYNLVNVTLHGWSPDGNWLLFSSYLGDPATGVLQKIKVNADGTLDTGSIVTILSGKKISGATWATREKTNSGNGYPLLLGDNQ